jgi:hypothetical protein
MMIWAAGYAHGQPGSGFGGAMGAYAEEVPQHMPTTDFGMPEILPNPPVTRNIEQLHAAAGAAGQPDLSFPHIPASSGADLLPNFLGAAASVIITLVMCTERLFCCMARCSEWPCHLALFDGLSPGAAAAA